MKKFKKLLIALLLCLPSLFLFGCDTIEVSGKTFRYDNVTIDWGMASNDDKEAFFTENQVANESELRNVLKSRDSRNSIYTTFGTDGKYTIKNSENEVIESGYYKQDESVITIAESEESLNETGATTWQANEKGYVVTIKLDDELKIFAKYEYSEQD